MTLVIIYGPRVYRSLVKRTVRGAYRALSGGDYERVLKSFVGDGVLSFPGEHALSGTFEGRDAIRRWWERLYLIFPDLRLEPKAILVNGFPWNTVVATRFTVTATLPGGRAYANKGMQLLRLRWGRIVEDFLYEDTQLLAATLAEMATSGGAAAAALPLAETGTARTSRANGESTT